MVNIPMAVVGSLAKRISSSYLYMLARYYVGGVADVRLFGAVCDCVLSIDGSIASGTDDTVAIQAAYDTGKSVFHPAFSKITAPILIDSCRWPGATDRGEGNTGPTWAFGGQRYFGAGTGISGIVQATQGANGFEVTDHDGLFFLHFNDMMIQGPGAIYGDSAWGDRAGTLTAASPAVLTLSGTTQLADNTPVLIRHNQTDNSSMWTITGATSTYGRNCFDARCMWGYVRRVGGSSGAYTYHVAVSPQWKDTLLSTDSVVSTTGVTDTNLTVTTRTGVGLRADDSLYFNQWTMKNLNFEQWNTCARLTVELSNFENIQVNLFGRGFWFCEPGPCNSNSVDNFTPTMQAPDGATGSYATMFPAISDPTRTSHALEIDMGAGWKIRGMNTDGYGLSRAIKFNTWSYLGQISGVIEGCHNEITTTKDGFLFADFSNCIYGLVNFTIQGNDVGSDGFFVNDCTLTSGTPATLTLHGTVATGKRFTIPFQLANGTAISVDGTIRAHLSAGGGLVDTEYYVIQAGGNSSSGYSYTLATTAAGAVATTANVNAASGAASTTVHIFQQPNDGLVKDGAGRFSMQDNTLYAFGNNDQGWPLGGKHMLIPNNGLTTILNGSHPVIAGGYSNGNFVGGQCWLSWQNIFSTQGVGIQFLNQAGTEVGFWQVFNDGSMTFKSENGGMAFRSSWGMTIDSGTNGTANSPLIIANLPTGAGSPPAGMSAGQLWVDTTGGSHQGVVKVY